MRMPGTMLLAAIAVLLMFSECDQNPAVTGSDDVVVLPAAQFTLTGYAIVDNGLVANGTVRNAGTTKYSPYWYAEGDFYADSTFTFKLGGAVQSYSFALNGGETTPLLLRFTSTTVDVNLYPHFRVKNLRAYRNKE